jgi:amino acid permease
MPCCHREAQPRKTMHASAVKCTFWRITLIYITPLNTIGLTMPYNDSRLYDGFDAGELSVVTLHRADSSDISPSSSPWTRLALAASTVCLSLLFTRFRLMT